MQIEGMRNLHKDCLLKRKCAACGVRYETSHWGKQAVKDSHKRGTALVCKQCVDNGCTARDPSSYTCSVCLRNLGIKKYNAKVIYYHNRHKKGSLACIECTEERKARVNHLRKQLQSSKRVCKCYCPIHTRTCPLTPCYHNERRWPGSDKKYPNSEESFISNEDRVFLDSLQPQPDWLVFGILFSTSR